MRKVSMPMIAMVYRHCVTTLCCTVTVTVCVAPSVAAASSAEAIPTAGNIAIAGTYRSGAELLIYHNTSSGNQHN